MLLSLFASAALTASAPDPAAADIAWITSGGFCEPETVLPLPDDTLLVSNVCDFGKAGNGFLSLLDANGEVLDWRILNDLDSPLGMALSGDRLYVIDNNQLKLFHWPSYEPLETIDLEAIVANDVAVAGDNTVFVSDTAGNRVIVIGPDGTQSVLLGEPGFPKANGMAINGDYLYVGGERLWRVSLPDRTVTTIGPAWLNDIDGIEFEAGGTLQITPVGGSLVRLCGNGRVEIHAGDGISSANHGYAPRRRLALIPTGFDNSVIAIRVPDNCY
jgi:hypothetical protein